ncbi:MAG: hypothetical protein H7Y60_08800 [Rhodospirillaceae bacterium]|nr:hypothetical protein [Rhodospirillales bacterium]
MALGYPILPNPDFPEFQGKSSLELLYLTSVAIVYEKAAKRPPVKAA